MEKMLYYRVVRPDMLFRFRGYLQTVPNELFTQGEVDKYGKPDKYGCRLERKWLTPVSISKNQTYFAFGARFGKINYRGENTRDAG